MPSSVGHNWIENYGGPNNPVSYNGTENYSIPPTNLSDRNTMGHDLNYDRLGGKGALSVFVNTNVLPADYTLIGQSFQVVGNPYNGAGIKDRTESFAIGTAFSIVTLPKIIAAGLSQGFNSISTIASGAYNGVSNIVNQFVQGVSSYNSSFSGW